MRNRTVVATLVLALSATLTACGSDDTTGSSGELSATEHNDADVTFATAMIQHHAQALVMVDLTAGRELDPEVAALAEEIRAAQAPEIETMADWLQEWGEDVPETVRDHANAGHDGHSTESHSSDAEDMPGMMTADDMAALENAGDAEFQEFWLEMMIEHHEGAVEMAETEEAEGQYEPAVDLAVEIQESQSAEIDTMEKLLG